MLILISIFILATKLISCSAKLSTCPAPTTPNFYDLARAAHLFEKLRICGQLVEVDAATDQHGRTFITYKAKIKDDSEASMLNEIKFD